jgi:hypothetical protein
LITSVDARAVRAYQGIALRPTAIMTLTRLGPRVAIIRIARMMPGNASRISIKRMRRLSTIPPARPEMSPMVVPMTVAITTATRPTESEMRAP